MKICTIMEWENFKDTENLKAYYKNNLENFIPFIEKLDKEHSIHRTTWSDGAGHMTMIVEFPSVEAYAKVLSNEEYRIAITNFCRHVQNVTTRTLLPAMSIPVE